MKLYATTTSERASKGQGGNEYIRIELQSDREKNEFVIVYTPDSLRVCASTDDGGALLFETHKEKGEKQKGDRLGKCHCGHPCIYGTDYCERHQTP